MAVLVTGGSGFMGSHLVKALLGKEDVVVAYDNFWAGSPKNLEGLERVVLCPGDILDMGHVIRVCQKHGVTRVIHGGAISSPVPAITQPVVAARVNIEGTINVLEAAAILGMERVVNISTEEVYGPYVADPMDEDQPKNPVTPYGVTKLASEGYCAQYRKIYGLDVVTVRPSWVYGPSLPRKRPPKLFIENALDGIETILTCGRDQCLDNSYIDDVTRGIMDLLYSKRLRHTVYNIASGDGRTIGQMADIVKSLIPGSRFVIGGGTLCYQHGFHMHQKGALDITRAREDLDYSPKYSLEDGLKAYVDHLKAEKRGV
ncbi:MAG: NAD-dependent epimerase/dehydratase family protein [Bacillota bacterium]|jgi:nucleoside-diphosphate-sugar epimerase